MTYQLIQTFRSIQVVAIEVQVRNEILTQELIQLVKIEEAIAEKQHQIVWNS